MTPSILDIRSLLDIKSEQDFNEKSLNLFRFQAKRCEAYKMYLKLLNVDINEVSSIEKIPYLPIEIFKSRKVQIGNVDSPLVFKSSGTTDAIRSKHFVKDPSVYELAFTKGFNHFYGSAEKYVFLGLLPSYLQKGESSLVYMTDHLIRQSKNKLSGFYLDEYDKLTEVLQQCMGQQLPTILLGVTYALIEFAETHPMDLGDIIVMETGGMKGRRKEMIRNEVHSLLKDRFNLREVHSEYGMTELLSQAYSNGGGVFHTPPWMKISFRENTDPVYSNFSLSSGIMNVIDLANVNSCSFIATQDLGKLNCGGIEILGRTDNSDIRGCSQLTI
jgi:phenylacetate-coenzyme A ligase PaaK-like adenylate-forming protein